MTGREKIQAAFIREGTDEIPAVICYEDIYIRDHWKQLTSCPWWYAMDSNPEKQVIWRNEVIPAIGQDWFALPMGYTKEHRENISIQLSIGVSLHSCPMGNVREQEWQANFNLWLDLLVSFQHIYRCYVLLILI